MLNAGRAIVWDSALGVGRHKVSDYVSADRIAPRELQEPENFNRPFQFKHV